MADERQELDERTAAEVGHAVIRFLVDEDPGSVGRLLPELDAADVDDALAAQLGITIVGVLSNAGTA